MVRKPPNSKAFCMFSSVDTQAGTIGPVNRLPFVYVTLLFFLFIFADSTRESIVCVCVCAIHFIHSTKFTKTPTRNENKQANEKKRSAKEEKNKSDLM